MQHDMMASAGGDSTKLRSSANCNDCRPWVHSSRRTERHGKGLLFALSLPRKCSSAVTHLHACLYVLGNSAGNWFKKRAAHVLSLAAFSVLCLYFLDSS